MIRRRQEKRDRPSWAAELAHPVPLGAVAVLALNDHLLKHVAWFPRVLSGKLSDAAGLFFFPLLLSTLADGAWRAATGSSREPLPGRGWMAAAAAATTGLVFSALKLSPAANGWACSAWGPIALDATDLATLPALALSVLWMTRKGLARAAPLPRWVRAGAVLFAAAASLATSPARLTRPYPLWQVADGGDAQLGCADVHVWAAKSGKEGMGLMVRITGRSAGTVSIEDARFELGSASYAAIARPPPFELVAGTTARAYLGFPFDGDDAWSRGERDGVVVLRLAACGQETTLRARLVDRVETPGPLPPAGPASSSAPMPMVTPDASAPPGESP